MKMRCNRPASAPPAGWIKLDFRPVINKHIPHHRASTQLGVLDCLLKDFDADCHYYRFLYEVWVEDEEAASRLILEYF